MSDNPEALKEAMANLKEALGALEPDEKSVVKSIQQEVSEALKAGSITNPNLEFCYTVKFSQDRISNPKLLAACETVIKAIEG